jgi:co-chaperonin GroES (HSP10)
MSAAALENIMSALDEPSRRELVKQLIRTLEDPGSSAEQLLDAQDKLDWFAREVKEWFAPAGYRLLVYIPYLQTKMENGLAMPDQSRSQYQTASIHAFVVALGPSAYQDQTRFPHGPWCQEGDRVVMRAYSGTRFKRAGYPFEYALINDDTVEGVIGGGIRIERPL